MQELYTGQQLLRRGQAGGTHPTPPPMKDAAVCVASQTVQHTPGAAHTKPQPPPHPPELPALWHLPREWRHNIPGVGARGAERCPLWRLQ